MRVHAHAHTKDEGGQPAFHLHEGMHSWKLQCHSACRRATLSSNGDSAVAEPDAHFQWQSPDGAITLPFKRDRRKALELAAEWDLCISGDGLHHLQHYGCEADFIPLVQVHPLSVCTKLAAVPLLWQQMPCLPLGPEGLRRLLRLRSEQLV